jgi:hypothetical protein
MTKTKFQGQSPATKKYKLKTKFCSALSQSKSVMTMLEKVKDEDTAYFPALLYLLQDSYDQKAAEHVDMYGQVEGLREELKKANMKIKRLEKRISDLTKKGLTTSKAKQKGSPTKQDSPSSGEKDKSPPPALPNSPLMILPGPSKTSTQKSPSPRKKRAQRSLR